MIINDLLPSHDHFFGFSKWTKYCMPYKMPYVWFWTDFDCVIPNTSTYPWPELHIIDFKVCDAPLKRYQQRMFELLETKQTKVITHVLRFTYPPQFFGDHLSLGEPRYATKIVLDNKNVTYEQLRKQLLEWHGFPKDLKIEDYLHPKLKKCKEVI